MSLEIYISGGKCEDRSISEITALIKTNCQVFKNCSYDEDEVQEGFYIKIFKIDSIEIIPIWDRLKNYCEIKCAFVHKQDEYQGCILNWPTIFTHSNCKK